MEHVRVSIHLLALVTRRCRSTCLLVGSAFAANSSNHANRVACRRKKATAPVTAKPVDLAGTTRYGATEAGCTYFSVSSKNHGTLRSYPGEGVPAGVPQAYVDVWVMASAREDLEDPLQPVATGIVGEICFGGGGEGFLARGKRSALGAELRDFWRVVSKLGTMTPQSLPT